MCCGCTCVLHCGISIRRLQPNVKQLRRGKQVTHNPTLLQLSEGQEAPVARHTSLRRRLSASFGHDSKSPKSSRSMSMKNRTGSGLYQRTIDSNALRRTVSNGIQNHEITNSRPQSAELKIDGSSSHRPESPSSRPLSTSSQPMGSGSPGTPNSMVFTNISLDDDSLADLDEVSSSGQPAVLHVASSPIPTPGPANTSHNSSYQSSLGYGPGQYVEQHLIGTPNFGEMQLGFQLRGQSSNMLAIDVKGAQNVVFRSKPTQLPEIYIKCYLQTDEAHKVVKRKTRHVPGSPDPHFNEVLVFSGNFKNKLIKVMIWEDHGVLGRNCMLGEIIIDMAILSLDLKPSQEVTGWYALFAPYSSDTALSAAESFSSLISSENSPTPSRMLHKGGSKKISLKSKRKKLK